MPAIHPKARTTPAVRAEIARSREPIGVLAQRYSVSTETIRKWRKRGPATRLKAPGGLLNRPTHLIPTTFRYQTPALQLQADAPI